MREIALGNLDLLALRCTLQEDVTAGTLASWRRRGLVFVAVARADGLVETLTASSPLAAGDGAAVAGPAPVVQSYAEGPLGAGGLLAQRPPVAGPPPGDRGRPVPLRSGEGARVPPRDEGRQVLGHADRPAGRPLLEEGRDALARSGCRPV